MTQGFSDAFSAQSRCMKFFCRAAEQAAEEEKIQKLNGNQRNNHIKKSLFAEGLQKHTAAESQKQSAGKEHCQIDGKKEGQDWDEESRHKKEQPAADVLQGGKKEGIVCRILTEEVRQQVHQLGFAGAGKINFEETAGGDSYCRKEQQGKKEFFIHNATLLPQYMDFQGKYEEKSLHNPPFFDKFLLKFRGQSIILGKHAKNASV